MSVWTDVYESIPIEGELVAVITSGEDGFCTLRLAILDKEESEWVIATVRDGMIYHHEYLKDIGEDVLYWSYLDEDIPQELVGV